MKALNFSYNWNNKLDNRAFTSIRLSDEYKVMDEFIINFKGQPKGTARIIEIKEFFIDQLNPFMAYIDTGYSVDECKNIIKKMYPNANWQTVKLKFILLKYFV